MVLTGLAREEELDNVDPLRHLMGQELESVELSLSSDELLVLPMQSHSLESGILRLSFFNNEASPKPVSIRLALDASPGCGGVAWPAGQVHNLYVLHGFFLDLVPFL